MFSFSFVSSEILLLLQGLAIWHAMPRKPCLSSCHDYHNDRSTLVSQSVSQLSNQASKHSDQPINSCPTNIQFSLGLVAFGFLRCGVRHAKQKEENRKKELFIQP